MINVKDILYKVTPQNNASTGSIV